MSVLDSDTVRDLLERAGLGGLSPKTLRAVLLLGGVLVGLGIWRFWPRAPAPELPLDPPAAASVEAEPSAPENVVVHVAGAVLHPGVYALPLGSRVDDALRAAGGGLGGASLDALNLARVLIDGEQVFVPTVEQAAAGAAAPASAAGQGSGSPASGGVVNINTASAQELEALPGVGPSTAQKIVDDREANGPFAKPEDLMRVPGIGAKKFESLRAYVACG